MLLASLFGRRSLCTTCGVSFHSFWLTGKSKTRSVFFAVPLTNSFSRYYASILILGQFANPTEAQLIQCVVFIMSGIYGRSYWTKAVDLMGFNVPLYILLTAGQAIGMIYFFYDSTKTVLFHIKQKAGTPEDWQKMNFGQAVTLLFPIAFLCPIASAWFFVSPNNILVTYPHQSFLLYGFIFASILNRMMVDRITKIPTNPYHWQLLIPLVGLLTALYSDLDVYVLFGGLVILLLSYFHFVLGIISQFCGALKINCFRIPYPPPQKTT